MGHYSQWFNDSCYHDLRLGRGLGAVCWWLFVGGCLLVAVCWWLFVGGCLLLAVCWWLFVVGCLLVIVCW